MLQLTNAKAEIAIHEAGHYVVAFVLGLEPTSLCIVNEGGMWTGEASHGQPEDRTSAVVRCLLAGFLAQAKFVATLGGGHVTFSANQDWNTISHQILQPTLRSEQWLDFMSHDAQVIQVALPGLGLDGLKVKQRMEAQPDAFATVADELSQCANLLDDGNIWDAINRLGNALQGANARYQLNQHQADVHLFDLPPISGRH